MGRHTVTAMKEIVITKEAETIGTQMAHEFCAVHGNKLVTVSELAPLLIAMVQIGISLALEAKANSAN